MASALAISFPAKAEGYAFPIDIHNGLLAVSLQDLAHQTGIELLFDRKLIGDQRSPALRERLPVDRALQRLLSGTDLVTRRAASGAWVIERRPLLGVPPPEDLAAPEILVVGHPTQDADIRRRENDIQPYQVATRDQIVDAHRDNLDQFFQSRITPNTTTAPPSFEQNGDTSSSIDLRGLGPDKTLILVDGGHLPGVPDRGIGFGQPDINAIPLHAIERVETLTGTAGGIYGLGALGGVVNVVLRHDYHGLEIHATTGVTAHGDAPRLSLEGGIGFTPDHGRTDVSLYLSQAWQRPLLEGQNGIVVRGREDLNRFSPNDSTGLTSGNNSVLVASESGGDLVLKPEYGGASLGSDHSFVPHDFSGTQADLAKLLAAHAGKVDPSLSRNEKASDLVSTPTTTSAIIDIRHRFGGGIEAYFDALILRNRGRYRQPDLGGSVTLAPDSPLNPFQNSITASVATPTRDNYQKTEYSTDRYTGGLIAPLPFNWRANAEATFGSGRYRDSYAAPILDSLDFTGVACPDVDPFADSETLQRSLAPCQHTYGSMERADNHYREQSLRLAGPVFRTAAGPATLTLLLQNRTENAPVIHYTYTLDSDVDSGGYGAVSSRTHSIYGEFEAPLIRDDAGLPLVDGLTLQLAVRRDWQSIGYPTYSGEAVHRSFAGTMYTAGAKLYPLPWLMLRGSYATGQQPPPIGNLQVVDYSSYVAELIDPKRGGVQPFNDDQYDEVVGGLTGKNVFASTLALGVVFNPDGESGPRVSIDYSRTHESGVYADPDLNLILAKEDTWPDRVTRAPLTDADRAKGYTGGVIQIIDARGLSVADVNATSIDAKLDWRMPFAGGILRTYGSVTRQLKNHVSGAAVDAVELVGFIDGPLKWRANGGAGWTKGHTTFGANLQYFGRYRIVGSEYLSFASVTEVPQGSKYVNAQAYLDLAVSRRFDTHWGGADHAMSIDLGIVNVLDHAPPYQYDSIGPQFSLYGDPRQRRFELTLNASF